MNVYSHNFDTQLVFFCLTTETIHRLCKRERERERERERGHQTMMKDQRLVKQKGRRQTDKESRTKRKIGKCSQVCCGWVVKGNKKTESGIER